MLRQKSIKFLTAQKKKRWPCPLVTWEKEIEACQNTGIQRAEFQATNWNIHSDPLTYRPL